MAANFATNTPTQGFCRDCLALQKSHSQPRCSRCGSPRLLRHKELYSLALVHVDCDAFYASVEKRDNPELRDKPLIIGGGKRGVVSTACYLARIHGVRSAMPMFKAREACPQAVIIKPDMEKYARVGREVRRLMQELTPLVEPVSIDEAFMDLQGTERLHGHPPAIIMARFAKRVEDEIGITISVGLSYCKYLAKIASDLDKPRGYSVIGESEALEFLRDKPVSMIWGVGKSFNAKLASDGIRTIGQLQTMDEATLMRAYGAMCQRLYRLARGQDTRTVEPEHAMKSVSAATTFNTDLSQASELTAIVRALSEKVSRRLKAGEIAGHTIVLKLKSKDFKLRTRNQKLSDPTQLADRIFRTGLQLLQRELDGTKFRLMGIGVTELSTADRADPPDLVDTQATKRAVAETAIDRLRNKFGVNVIETGYTFSKGDLSKTQTPSDRDPDP